MCAVVAQDYGYDWSIRLYALANPPTERWGAVQDWEEQTKRAKAAGARRGKAAKARRESIQPLEPVLLFRHDSVAFEASSVASSWLSCDEVSKISQGIITKNLIVIPFKRRINSSLWSRAHSRAFLSALIPFWNVSASVINIQTPRKEV